VTVAILHPVDDLRRRGEWDDVVARIGGIDPRVAVIGEEYVEPHEVRVIRRGPDAEAARGLTPEPSEPLRAVLAAAQVALALDLPLTTPSYAPNLRWVQSYGAGTGHLLSAGLLDAGIRLTSGAGVNATGIAEFAIARVLQHWKGFRGYDELQSRRQWEHFHNRELAGATIGLIGLGAINSRVAARLRGFEVRLLATRRSAKPGTTTNLVDELFAVSDLHEMLGRCDAVIAAVPGTLETEKMMDSAAIDGMRPGAFFVNVGRGSLVDETALTQALRSGHLSGAALDVTVREPLPPDDPLWDAPNVYISAHSATAAGSLWPNLLNLFCENLRRYIAGEDLLNEFEASRGY
jgi:phosphoglycerate dehydrogenase-like enzyme